MDELAVAYGEGASLAELARRFEVHRQTVQRHLSDRGVLLRVMATVDDALATQLAVDYEAGATIRELATEHGLSESACGRALHRLGVAMRPRARRGRRLPSLPCAGAPDSERCLP